MFSRHKNGNKLLGEVLVSAGKIDARQLKQALKIRKRDNKYLGRILVEAGHIDDDELQQYLPKSVAKARTLATRELDSLDDSEFYRLQTALKFVLFSDDPIKSLLVSSAAPGEGKTTCASYLARVLATVRDGKFLLVDADLHNPSLHKRYDVPQSPGLADCIVNGHTIDKCLARTDLDNLYLLPAGTLPPNPAALFASNAMKMLVGVLEEFFELVVFDSSPLLPLSTTSILSTHIDSTIMVIRAGHTSRKLVQKSLKLLNGANTKVLGVVLNQIVERDIPKYYYKYSGRPAR